MAAPPNVTELLLTGFGEMDNMKYLYFFLTLLAFFLTLYLNMFLLVVVYLNENLHKPMYLFLCNLFINGLYLSVALYPQLLINLLADMKVVSRSWCQIQVFCIHTYAAFECTILTVMAYDRFVSICLPLQYHSIMTPATVNKLIAVAWLFPVFILGIHIGFTSSLPLCGNIVKKVYCDNWSVVRLSCIDTTRESLFGIFVTVLFPCVPMLLILFSYQRILRACLKASSDARSKALNTCLPHIISFLTYSLNILFEIISRRLDSTSVPLTVQQLISLQLFIVPPLLNPLIYGIRLQEMRTTTVKVLWRQKISNIA